MFHYAPKIDDEISYYYIDKAYIQRELEKEEKIHLEVKKQNIDEEIVMEETIRTIETKAASEDLNMLL